MNLLIILKVALRSLRRTLLRSSLTALGIIIGVAAVITLVSIGNGAKARIEASFAGMDTNRLQIGAHMPREMWRRGMQRGIPRGDGLNLADYEAIRERVPGIAAANLQAQVRTNQANANGVSTSASITGVDVEGLKILSREVVAGTSFGQADIEAAASICLISEFLAQTFFGNRPPIGRMIRIGEVPFLVIGVVANDERNQNYVRPEAGDSTVLVPYSSVLRRLERNAQISIVLKAENPAELGRIQRDVLDLLESRRGNRKVEFSTGNIEETLRTYREGSETMTLLLGAIAGISLLVGGIGIMNIMLVSVTERTREIGIRLAIGTRGKDVLRQFMIEAVILSVLGGMIGILLGVGAAALLTYTNGMPTQVTLGSVLASFLCSAGIGVFFGYYPARQAAQLDPIEALRAE